MPIIDGRLWLYILAWFILNTGVMLSMTTVFIMYPWSVNYKLYGRGH